jgi:peptidoglycan hydrolase CwlO-like protein
MLIEIAVLLFLFLLIFFGLLQQPGGNLDLDFRGKKLKKHENAQQNFVHGFQELNKAVLILNNAEIDETTTAKAVTAIARTMSSPLRLAYRHFTAALKVWEEENARQDEEVEKLVSKIGSLTRIVSENNVEMKKLQEELSSLNNLIQENEKELKMARNSLRRAEDVYEESKKQLREKIKQRDVVKATGIAATVVALFAAATALFAAATIAIASIIEAFEDAVKNAQRNVTSAEDNVNTCTNKLREKQGKKMDLDRELRRKRSENEKVEKDLTRLKSQLQQLKETQGKSIELGEKLKKTCYIMMFIWGKSKVLNDEAQRAYILEPFLTPLREIFTMLTPEEQRKIKADTFLLSNDTKLRAISLKLKTIRSKGDNLEAILDEYT